MESNLGVQEILKENAEIVETLAIFKAAGKEDNAATLQFTLHRNLMHLAQLADEEAKSAEGAAAVDAAAHGGKEGGLVREVKEAAVDFDALATLEEEGIDMSFLDSLKAQYYGEEEGGEVKGEKDKEGADPGDEAEAEDERPHKCADCGKGFKRKDHLKRHSRTHKGEDDDNEGEGEVKGEKEKEKKEEAGREDKMENDMVAEEEGKEEVKCTKYC